MNTLNILTNVLLAHTAALHGNEAEFETALLAAHDAAMDAGRGDIEEAIQDINPEEATDSLAALAVIGKQLASELNMA